MQDYSIANAHIVSYNGHSSGTRNLIMDLQKALATSPILTKDIIRELKTKHKTTHEKITALSNLFHKPDCFFVYDEFDENERTPHNSVNVNELMSIDNDIDKLIDLEEELFNNTILHKQLTSVLTHREYDIISSHWFYKESTKQTEQRLGISHQTLSNHRTSAMIKMKIALDKIIAFPTTKEKVPPTINKQTARIMATQAIKDIQRQFNNVPVHEPLAPIVTPPKKKKLETVAMEDLKARFSKKDSITTIPSPSPITITKPTLDSIIKGSNGLSNSVSKFMQMQQDFKNHKK
jgi:DNA-binding CsgD family transcriptional regulator